MDFLKYRYSKYFGISGGHSDRTQIELPFGELLGSDGNVSSACLFSLSQFP